MRQVARASSAIASAREHGGPGGGPGEHGEAEGVEEHALAGGVGVEVGVCQRADEREGGVAEVLHAGRVEVGEAVEAGVVVGLVLAEAEVDAGDLGLCCRR
jgi:hypothetical protein